jgi:hypothetical protein
MLQALVYLDYGRLLSPLWQRVDGGSREAFGFDFRTHAEDAQKQAVTKANRCVSFGRIVTDLFTGELLRSGRNNFGLKSADSHFMAAG